MRLVELIVDAFQTVEHCKLTFCSGLNVVHGPNDLGKSTLARAIRAALLLPHGSSDAESFIPWYGDHVPSVTLTFTDSSGRFYRVRKQYGGSGRGRSLLESSKDARDWIQEVTGREVDEKLRAILCWGIPPPGGKGAPKGLPASFIARTLLADQNDVTSILEESIDDDPCESGRLKLTKALQGLAQDPRVKQLLDRAQAEVDAHFTPTGRRKGGQGSPFKAVAEEIQGLTRELEALEADMRRSKDAEERADELRGKSLEADDKKRESTEQVQRVRDRLRKTSVLAAAKAEVDRARTDLAAIDQRLEQIRSRERAFAERESRLAKLNELLESRRRAIETARSALDEAKDALRRATSAEAAAERKVRRAELETRRVGIEGRRTTAEAKRKRAEEASTFGKKAEELKKQVTETDRLRALARTQADQAQKALAQADTERDQLKEALAFGRWDRARRAVEEVKAALEESKGISAAAEEVESCVKAKTLELASEPLPDSEVVRRIERLEQDLRVAEASLGGGFSMIVRPRRPLDIVARPDGGEPNRSSGTNERRFEATRSMSLIVEETLELDVVAGDVERRRAAEKLRTRWSSEAVPVLAASGVSTGVDLAERRRTRDAAERDLWAKREEVTRLSARANELSLRGSELPSLEGEIASWSVQVEGRDRTAAKAVVEKLGIGWETQLTAKLREAELKRSTLNDGLTKTLAEVARLEQDLAHLAATSADAIATAKAAEDALGSTPQCAIALTDAEITGATSELDDIGRAIAALDLEGRGQEQQAQALMKERDFQLGDALESMAEGEKQLLAEQTAFGEAKGELKRLREEADASPREPAHQRVTDLERARAELPIPDQPAMSEDGAKAEETARIAADDAQHARQELASAQGALAQVGGAVLRERVAEVRAALERAKERQRELELDADAWKLLTATLKEAEAGAAQHLGRAIGTDLSQRVAKLTSGRYGSIEIEPTLKTKGIMAAGALRGIDVLSVGTRDQLATLLRLAVAESLESAIVLDDQLVQTDPDRLAWFRARLAETAAKAQVIVFTCRREDYDGAELAGTIDVRHLDLNVGLRRFSGAHVDTK